MSQIPPSAIPASAIAASPLPAGLSAAALSLDTPAAKDAGPTQAQQEAVKEFEAVFVSMLIKEMRQGAEGLFPGDSTDSLGALFDMHIGQQIADAGGLGISSQILRYIEAQNT